MTEPPEFGPEPEDDDLAAIEEWYRWHCETYGEEPEMVHMGPTYEIVTPREEYL